MVPSSWAHIAKLIVLLVVGVAGFLTVMDLLVPSSWDPVRWYRVDAVAELGSRPLAFGGNQSCASARCHDEPTEHRAKLETLTESVHKTLACEGCHGARLRHVRDDRRVESARIEPSIGLCLGCHAPLISRHEDFPQFDEEDLTHRRRKVTTSTPCKRCHDPHDPEEKPRKDPGEKKASLDDGAMKPGQTAFEGSRSEFPEYHEVSS